jgi:two-component system LytT family sensor kinase/two-component system sensor histidine kinase LytS
LDNSVDNHRDEGQAAKELLIKLAGIFRRTLRRDIYQITLAEEIEFCQDYLDIEKARLDKRLQVKWKIPNELKETIIPPFIIQPLIENAIKHGIYPQENGGKITISAQKLADKLQIKIKDNGPGIKVEKIAEIENGNNDRIGINNIKERLHSVYGSSAEFKIKSNTEKGTQNIIRIPSEFLFERRKAI